jgi:DNA-binding protein HU-beta
MNKGDLVSEVVKRTGVGRPEAASVVDALLATIRDRVARGERVSLSGFGTFERQRRNPRLGRNPRTREAVKIPARYQPAFRPGGPFRQAVLGRRRKKAGTARKTTRKR